MYKNQQQMINQNQKTKESTSDNEDDDDTTVVEYQNRKDVIIITFAQNKLMPTHYMSYKIVLLMEKQPKIEYLDRMLH